MAAVQQADPRPPSPKDLALSLLVIAAIIVPAVAVPYAPCGWPQQEAAGDSNSMNLAANISVGATIYTVFFAISWGTYSNALPRWKPFHYAMLHRARPAARLALSWLMLNIIPWILFAWDFAWLQRFPVEINPNLVSGSILVAPAVAPGFVPFGCYRLWLAIVQTCPHCFYYSTQDEVPQPYRRTCPEKGADAPSREPDKLSLGLLSICEGQGWIWDAAFGLFFVAFCLLPIFLR